MEAKLVVVRGKASKGAIPLSLPTVIGRSREADLTIAHPAISRKHCELFEDDGLLRIRDLGSLNGTFVGKKQIKETELQPNAEFSIGPLTFRVLYKYDGKAAPARKRPAKAADDQAAEEDVPDFTLLDDLSDEPAEPLLEDLPEPTVSRSKPKSQPTRPQAGKPAVGGDDDVLDFLLDEEPKAKKKAGQKQGTDDDDLDQFFKQLG